MKIIDNSIQQHVARLLPLPPPVVSQAASGGLIGPDIRLEGDPEGRLGLSDVADRPRVRLARDGRTRDLCTRPSGGDQKGGGWMYTAVGW